MRMHLLAMLVASVAFQSAFAQETGDRWNLADLYPSTAAWNADADKLESQFKEFAACKGTMGQSAARLRQCLDLQADMNKRYLRMAAFSSEQVSEDTGNPAYLELDQRSDILGTKLSEATAFVDPEILHIGKDRIAQFLTQE